MRAVLRWLGTAFLVLLFVGGLLWTFGPRPEMELDIGFDPSRLGDDLDAYLAEVEAGRDFIAPGVEKRIVWAGESGAATDLALLYFHGYSATSREIHPVAERVADRLGANLYLPRFAGHGVPGEALGDVEAGDWLEDVAEALAIGDRLGQRVIVIGTSTGATLATIAVSHPDLAGAIDGLVFVAPNFGINTAAAALLTMPFAGTVLPVIGGETRSWHPLNEEHGRYWTTTYPTRGLPELGAAVKAARQVNYTRIDVPVLAIFTDEDRVVDAGATRTVLSDWGGPVEIVNPVLTDGDDPMAHVIAGDIVSPSQTDAAIEAITDWIGALQAPN